MFKTRVITAVIGIPVLLAVLFLGGWYWKLFFTLMALMGLWEFTRMMAHIELKPMLIPGLLLLILFLFRPEVYLYPGVLGILVLAVIISVINYPLFNIKDISLTFFGAAYIGFLLSYAINISALQQSFLVMLLALILTWASDTGAYLAGKLWGRHKMAPRLSPNKTWEGATGGLVLCAITGFVFFLIIDIDGVSRAYALLLGGSASIMAQLGDLFISAAKRYFQVKDTGKILPGHGGILDRFDSFLLVVPLVYYFALYIL